MREARALRASVLRHPPGHIQRTAAYFLSLGHYDALIRRMGTALQERRREMDTALDNRGLTVSGRGASGGSSYWMRAPEGINTDDLTRRLQAKGVLIEPGRAFFAGDEQPGNYYRLAYSSIPSTRIAKGLDLIADEIERHP